LDSGSLGARHRAFRRDFDEVVGSRSRSGRDFDAFVGRLRPFGTDFDAFVDKLYPFGTGRDVFVGYRRPFGTDLDAFVDKVVPFGTGRDVFVGRSSVLLSRPRRAGATLCPRPRLRLAAQRRAADCVQSLAPARRYRCVCRYY
jgi:hypothetical protein